MNDTKQGVIEIQPRTLFAHMVCEMIVKLMRRSYRLANQRFILRLIFNTIFRELQEEFNEDNRPTSLAFMVEETLNGSGMDHNGLLYKKLSDIVNSKK